MKAVYLLCVSALLIKCMSSSSGASFFAAAKREAKEYQKRFEKRSIPTTLAKYSDVYTDDECGSICDSYSLCEEYSWNENTNECALYIYPIKRWQFYYFLYTCCSLNKFKCTTSKKFIYAPCSYWSWSILSFIFDFTLSCICSIALFYDSRYRV